MIKHLPAEYSNNFIKLRNGLISATGKAIGDYNMIEDGDTVLVCMSGGKDSHAMLMILLALQERAPIDFKLIAMNLDQKQPGFPADILPAYFEKLGVDYRIVNADTYSIVKEKIPEGKRLFVTNHESFGYYADRYGFKVIGTIIPSSSSASSPSAKEISELIGKL